MQRINALSLTQSVNNWLVTSRQPHILHVFEHACNLINEHREVLSIVTSQIGNGPFNLVVGYEVLFSEYLNIESPIFIHGTRLDLGNLTINTIRAKLWDPHPDWERLHDNRNDIVNVLTQLQIKNYLNLGGFDTPLDEHPGLLNHRGLSFTNNQFSNSLASSLAIADRSSSLAAAQKLAGLGIGLTPAGDDFIMGAIYAAWIIHPFEVASILVQVIANSAAALTTSLSAAWLRSAARGEAGIPWHNFFDALTSADPTQIQRAMDNILAVGETSGADALAGFIHTLVAWAIEERTKNG